MKHRPDFQKGVPSKVSGVTSGDDALTRQTALKILAALPEDKRPKYLDLVPEEENEYDRDAIMVFAEVPSLGRVQIGYVKNSDCYCGMCGEPYSRFPSNGMCTVCNGKDIRREGMATALSQEMRRDSTLRFYAMLLEVTGGGEKKSYGCNIMLKQVFDRKKFQSKKD